MGGSSRRRTSREHPRWKDGGWTATTGPPPSAADSAGHPAPNCARRGSVSGTPRRWYGRPPASATGGERAISSAEVAAGGAPRISSTMSRLAAHAAALTCAPRPQ